MKDFRWPLTLHFLTVLTARINELNSELEGENTTAIKNTGTTDFFRGKLKLRKAQRKRLSGQKAQSFSINHVEERDIGEVLKLLLPCSG
jgi:hypothetical protein